MLITLDLRADIVPAKSMGGIDVGTSIRELQPLIAGAGLWNSSEYRLVSPFEASYLLGEGALEVVVDVRNGNIARISARPGYTGAAFGRISVGMKVEQALQRDQRLYYDEAEELILCRGVRGISFNVSAVDPPIADVPGLTISAISVYDLAIETAAGQKGEW